MINYCCNSVKTIIILHNRSAYDVDSHREHREHLVQVPALCRRRRAGPGRGAGRADWPARIVVPRLRHRDRGGNQRPHPSRRSAGQLVRPGRHRLQGRACRTRHRGSPHRRRRAGGHGGGDVPGARAQPAVRGRDAVVPSRAAPDAAGRAVRDGVLRPDARIRHHLRRSVRVEGRAGNPPVRVPRSEPPRGRRTRAGAARASRAPHLLPPGRQFQRGGHS